MKRAPLRQRPPGQQTAPERSGFSTVTELRVRARAAGGGYPWQARCEACGTQLGLHGGTVRRVTQPGPGIPGCGPGVAGSAANAVLLCVGCSAACEAEENPRMQAAGFWQPPGTDPRAAPMTPHGTGGTPVWRDAGGRYLPAPPEPWP